VAIPDVPGDDIRLDKRKDAFKHNRARVRSCGPVYEDIMRQLVILPHNGDGAPQLTSAAWLRSTRNLMTSTTPPAFLGAFLKHQRCVTAHATG